MTTPVEMDAQSVFFTQEDELGPLDWSSTPKDGSDASQEINDRRALQESAETLRLVRAL